MQRLFRPWLLLACATLLVATAWARDYKLMDGSTIAGEVSDGNDYGVVFRQDVGGFTKRIPWSKFTQETLKLLAEEPKYKRFVEPFIEVPPEFNKPKPKPPVQVREVDRVDRPTGRTSFFSSFTTPIGLAALGVLYVANLLAAYEIARYRNRPIAVVCGLSALLPLFGPLVFLVSPSLESHDSPESAPTVDQTVGSSEPGAPGVGMGRAAGAQGAGAGLRVAATAEKGVEGGSLLGKVFKRGDYTFNRRFIETQFTGFFRVVPSEAEKDLVLVVTTPKKEFVGKRISRISSNEFYLQLLQGGGKEVSIGFTEIAQIAVKNKDEIRD
jgi:hypothetical protein